MKKKYLILSAGRSDFERYYPIIKKLKTYRKNLDIKIFLFSAHYSKVFGSTYKQIKKEFSTVETKKKISFPQNKRFLIKNLSKDINNISKAIENYKPDFMIVMGDRYEMLAGPYAALHYNLPVIHIYGGALSEGAIDDLIRHSISKMSHIHLVALDVYKKRLMQLGEESWRIKTIGIPELKYLTNQKQMSLGEISKSVNLDFNTTTLLVTFHPVTLELNKTNKYISNLLDAIKKTNFQAVFTYPNADQGSHLIIKKIKKFVRGKKKYTLIKNCEAKLYANLMRKCNLMIGNSSSGIVEACSFKLPTVNIGTRQKGKFKPKNVVNSKYDSKNILKSIKFANSKLFKNKIKKYKNPYASKMTLSQIISFIIKFQQKEKLIKKKFIDRDFYD